MPESPNYHLVAIARHPDGSIEIMGGQTAEGRSVKYRLTKESAWTDLNDLLDDPDLPTPEPVQAAAAGVEEPGEAIAMVEEVATSLYGPIFGKVFRSVAVAGKTAIRRMQE